MQVGRRIYYDENTGKVIFQMGEMEGDILPRNIEKIKYIDLPFNDKILENAIGFHIENETIVIDKILEEQLTEEEKLKRENEELENQLLIAENNNIDGGIL